MTLELLLIVFRLDGNCMAAQMKKPLAVMAARGSFGN
jgi:hypothetical protein